VVEEAVLAPFAERLVARAESWRLGDPLDPATQVGPLASAEQLATVSGYLERGRRDGARVLAGGARASGALGDGYFVPPCVLTDVDPAHPLAREEIFGPVAALLPVRDYEAAVALANDTPFGLCASLFTNDLGRALRFAREARVGVVKINQESAGLELQAPFGGMKASSTGPREQGKAAREFFTQWKTVYLDTP
jgi:aldehyde dehydrogenase (NAD+)